MSSQFSLVRLVAAVLNGAISNALLLALVQEMPFSTPEHPVPDSCSRLSSDEAPAEIETVIDRKAEVFIRGSASVSLLHRRSNRSS